MKKFRFALENVLKYRKSIEDQEKELLARAMNRVEQEERLSQELDEEKRGFIKSCNIDQCQIGDMSHRDFYLTSLDKRIKNQQVQLDKAIKVSNNIRIKVVDATAKRKVLESLKDKQLEEYRELLSRAEQKLLDEVGISSYCRKEMNQRP